MAETRRRHDPDFRAGAIRIVTATMDGAGGSTAGVTIRSVGAMGSNGEAFLAELDRELAMTR